MKIVLLNSTFDGKGSTDKIINDLRTEFIRKQHEVYVLYGRKKPCEQSDKIIKFGFEFESKICHLVSLITGNIYGMSFFATKKAMHLIKKIKPDIVNIHCLNGYCINIYALLKFLKRKKINTTITNHAEFMYTGNCSYSIECNKWFTSECKKCARIKEFNGSFSLNRTHLFFKKMEKSFKDFSSLKVINVSPWVTERAKLSPFFKDKFIKTILNPVKKYPTTVLNPYLKYKLNKNKKIVLFMTANFNNNEKGGFFIDEIAERLKNNDIHFFVKSAVPPKSIKSHKNVTFILDEMSQAETFSLYHYANATLLLSLRETFSMIVAESLMQGTPIVGFKAGGPETIGINNYCYFCKYGDIETLTKTLSKVCATDFNKEEIARIANTKYNVEKISQEYLDVYEK